MARKTQNRRPAPAPAATATTDGPRTRPNSDAIAVVGRVTDALPNAMFAVELENGHNVLGHLSGRMRKNFIRVLPGAGFTVELPPSARTGGRIPSRHR